MVGHQAVAVQDQTKLLDAFSKRFENELSVLVAPKDGLAFVSTRKDVVGRSLEFNANGSGHDFESFNEISPVRQVSRSDPVPTLLNMFLGIFF